MPNKVHALKEDEEKAKSIGINISGSAEKNAEEVLQQILLKACEEPRVTSRICFDPLGAPIGMIPFLLPCSSHSSSSPSSSSYKTYKQLISH